MPPYDKELINGSTIPVALSEAQGNPLPRLRSQVNGIDDLQVLYRLLAIHRHNGLMALQQDAGHLIHLHGLMRRNRLIELPLVSMPLDRAIARRRLHLREAFGPVEKEPVEVIQTIGRQTGGHGAAGEAQLELDRLIDTGFEFYGICLGFLRRHPDRIFAYHIP